MKRILPYSLVLSLCLVLLLPACVTTQPTTTQPSARFVSPKLIEVPTGRGNVNTPIWWMPHDAAQATLVLFLGGPGALGPNDNDALNDPNSWEGHPAFMLRDWELFYKEGFNVAIVGRAQDRVQEQDNRSRNPLPFRTSAEHSSDIRNVLLNIKKLAPEGGIWLVGSSLGTISIANATISNPDIIAGQVMLGGVTHLGGDYESERTCLPCIRS